MAKPRKVKTAGALQQLTVNVGRCRCGDIDNGVSFEFGNDGGWVVSLDELEAIVAEAHAARRAHGDYK